MVKITTKKATKQKSKAFVNSTEGVRGLIAQFLRAVFVIPEPKEQR